MVKWISGLSLLIILGISMIFQHLEMSERGEHNPVQELDIAGNYPNVELVYFDTILEGLEAVAKGELGCLQQLNFRSARNHAGMSFAVQKENSALSATMNREISLLPENLYKSTLNEYYFEQSREDYKKWIKQNVFWTMLLFLVILWGIGLYLKKWEKKKLEEGRKRLLAEISHDMRTPCTVVNGYLKAMQNGLIPEKEKDQYIKVIQRKMEEILELLNTFHEYSLVEHPDLPLHREKVNICALIQRYFAGRYEELEWAAIGLEVDIPEEHIYCNIDEKLFIPFSGGTEKGNGGSGLGQAIVHRIIVAHGGSISLAQSADAKCGTKYRIKLPAVRIEEKDRE